MWYMYIHAIFRSGGVWHRNDFLVADTVRHAYFRSGPRQFQVCGASVP
jgi:hypothetical protein